MRILAIGDIVAADGREFVYNNLGKIRDKYKIDFCIANGENAADRNGITKNIASMLIERGVDVITLGNHTFANPEGEKVLENNPDVIRPLNMPSQLAGEGYVIRDIGLARIAVINLIGRINMQPADCPFHAVERVLREIEGRADIIVVDMHADATSERLAMGNFLDGRAHIVYGTHTHVQTADEHILPGGTAYISDLGMTGVMDSVLGVKKEIIIDYYYNMGKRYRFEKAEGETWFNGCVFDIEQSGGRINSIERLRFCEI